MNLKEALASNFREVYKNKPRTVSKKKKGRALRKQLAAIAYSKTRQAGYKI